MVVVYLGELWPYAHPYQIKICQKGERDSRRSPLPLLGRWTSVHFKQNIKRMPTVIWSTNVHWKNKGRNQHPSWGVNDFRAITEYRGINWFAPIEKPYNAANVLTFSGFRSHLCAFLKALTFSTFKSLTFVFPVYALKAVSLWNTAEMSPRASWT